ncbi:MRS7 family protein [Histoplasma capsulatum var. duboisii H88]|uniref:MRS7 family protein n=1 Tax=Ajellomyces capsulatus (strain H88) TaxID=544711 RepID=F0UJ29_AJEC8|nr:MRS7 family protein [Histoplasma capsulatum var. duboisii H88]QSS56330.1 MRS7 family protein [Histoplasma capsulatum var. duboisii H88]
MKSVALTRNAVSAQRMTALRRHSPGNLGTYLTATSRYRRSLPQHVQALAILIPLQQQQQRGYATQQTPSTNPLEQSPFPPPGFSADLAKKPLPAETAQKPTPASLQSEKTECEPREQIQVTAATDRSPAKGLVAEGRDLSSHDVEAAEITAVEEKKGTKKLTLGQRIKKEAQHYWDGTKLLATEVKISTQLALKMAAGYELSRREHRQLRRTVQDLARLVPFSVFVIVPFAEFLLPVALKLFPNLLPSTYEGQKSKEEKAAILQATRREMGSFLQNTLKETGLPVNSRYSKKEEFTEFFRKVRATGESPSEDDVIKVCQTFKDDLTLDNLSRPQLVAMCKYINLNTFGTDAMLRYNVRHRMRQIKRDDKAISFEGVDTLSVPELQMACASRGLRTHGISPGRLRDDLSMWLDLRLKKGVPSTLLVLSNAYMYTQNSQDYEISSQIDALRSVLSSIPEELFHEIELEVHNAEGAATNKQRLEVIKEQQELIEEENEQNTENEEAGVTAPKDHEDIDETDDKNMEAAAPGQETQSSEAQESENDTEKQQEKEKKE